MLDDVPDTQPEVADRLAAITAVLVGEPDAAGVLRLVTGACRDLLGAATGVLLTAADGRFRVAAASDERTRLVELLQSQIEQGPCVEAITGARLVAVPDLVAEQGRWPVFTEAASGAGFGAVYALPLRVDGRAVGGLNLLYTAPRELSPEPLRLARALTDLATLGLTQFEPADRAGRVAAQTVTALNDRVELDHAVGMVAGATGVDPARARAVLEDYARSRRRPLRHVVRQLTEKGLDPAELTSSTPSASRSPDDAAS